MSENEAQFHENIPEELPRLPLIAKAVPPACSESPVARTRLNQVFDEGLPRSIMLVNAAEGYGKTTALIMWREHLLQLGKGVCWINVDSDDRDPQRFWMNLRFALKFSLDDFELPEQDVFDASRQARWLLANALSTYAFQVKPLVIIVEGFDNLDGSDTFFQVIELGQTIAPQVHLCLSSRYCYARSIFARAGLAESPLYVSGDDLAFTQDELRDLAECRLSRTVSSEVLEDLYRKTRGWPYGVEEALAAARNASDPERALAEFSGVTEVLEDFFEQEVFAPLPKRCQDFLLLSASLSYLNPRLCAYSLDWDDAGKILEDLHARNAFLGRAERSNEALMPNPLFSDWVNYRARNIPPEQYRQINARASHWLYEHGYSLDAVKHQIMSIERADIFELVQAAYPTMSARELQKLSRTEGLSYDQDELPAAYCLLAAWAYAFSADKEMLQLWIERVRDLVNQGRAPEVELSLGVLTVKEKCLAGDFDGGLALASDLVGRLTEEYHRPLRVMLANCYAESFDMCGDFRSAYEYHRKMSAYAGLRSSRYMVAINRYEIVCLDYEQGNVTDAIQECQSILETVPLDFPVYPATEAFLAYLLVTQGEEEGVNELLAKCHAKLEPYHNIDMYIDAAIANAWCLVGKGFVEQADEVLMSLVDKAVSPSTIVPRGRAALPFMNRALLALMLGDADKAISVRGEQIGAGVRDTAYSSLVWDYVNIAVALSAGEPALNALASLDAVIERAENMGLKRLLVDFYLEEANLHAIAGERSKAHASLKKALEYSVNQKIVAPFFCRAGALRRLFVSYLDKAAPSYQARSFIRYLLRSSAFAKAAAANEATETVKLTKREKAVLHLMATGYKREEVAEELCISPNTLKAHLSHLYGKFGVSSYDSLLRAIAELGGF